MAEKVQPNFRTINRFIKANPEFVKNAFKQTVSSAAKNNIIDPSFLSIDCSMFKASAGSKRYFDQKGLDRLDKAVDRMIKEDIALDDLEDELDGDNPNDGTTAIDRRDMKRIIREFKQSEDKKKIKKNIEQAKNELEKLANTCSKT